MAGEPASIRLPPPWATASVGLSRSKLSSGANGVTRLRLGTLDDRRVVGLGLEAEQREFESALAVLGAVTGSLVATQLGQHRLDLVAEADLSRL